MMHILPKDALKMHKHLLCEFWARTTHYKENYRKSVSKLSKERCLNELRAMGTIKLHYNSTHTRKKFNSIKSKGKYQYQLCLACGERATVRHHIIWLRNGGRNNKLNIAGLCTGCHAEVHPWLKL